MTPAEKARILPEKACLAYLASGQAKVGTSERHFALQCAAMNEAPISHARIEWQQDGLPWSPLFGDIYFSRADGGAETRHVFLDGNDLPARFAAAGERFVIGECGFGSGLNFLLAWQLWDKVAPPGSRMYFISAEQFPLRHEDLMRFHALWPELAPWCRPLQESWVDQGNGLHRLVLGSTQKPVYLDLLLGDASTRFGELLRSHAGLVDAWFLDGFAPRSNPAMWSGELFRHMATLSHSGTTLATYSVAAVVKQGLQEAGFSIAKAPGHGNKRHMLKARLQAKTTSTLSAQTARPGTSVAIIGGGIAGCSVARALARKGCHCVVLEQGNSLAPGASGNPRGVLFLPLHREPSAKTRYLRQSYLFAARQYTTLSSVYSDIDWQGEGALQLTRKNSEDYFERVAENSDYWPGLVSHLDATEATAKAGIAVEQDALYLPLSGTLKPAELCRALASDEAVTVRTGCRVDSMRREGEGWALLDGAGNTIVTTSQVVIANARDALHLLPDSDYPLHPNRGQLTRLQKTPASAGLQTVLCGRGYLSPIHGGEHICGGCFNPGDDTSIATAEDSARNLALLRELNPAVGEAFGSSDILGERAAQRCTTRDYLPLIGAVATLTGETLTDPLDAAGEQGLYLFSGLGSHGITTSALGAELLASMMTGDPWPIEPSLAALIAPARFAWRKARKGQA